MAAKNTVNIQRMRTAASELDRIYTSMSNQIKKLEETIAAVKQNWHGDAANTYLKQYEKNQLRRRSHSQATHMIRRTTAQWMLFRRSARGGKGVDYGS